MRKDLLIRELIDRSGEDCGPRPSQYVEVYIAVPQDLRETIAAQLDPLLNDMRTDVADNGDLIICFDSCDADHFADFCELHDLLPLITRIE